MSSLLRELYFFYAWASLGVVVSCLVVRTMVGAMPWTLVRTRFYEIPPLRLAIRLAHLSLWSLMIAAKIIIGMNLLAWLKFKQDQHWEAAAAVGVGWLAVVTVTWIFHVALVQIGVNSAPQVSVRRARLGRKLNRAQFQEIGKRQFPQMVEFGHVSGLRVRFLLVTVIVVMIAAGALAGTDWGRDTGLREQILATLGSMREEIPTTPVSLRAIVGMSCLLGMVLLCFHNFSYTLISFPCSLAFVGIQFGGIFWSAAESSIENEKLGIGLLVVSGCWGWRWLNDLSRARQFRRMYDVKAPLQALLKECVRFLPDLRRHADYQLPSIDVAEISRRITSGCRNVESADRLVTRNFARFLTLVQVDHEACATAMLRLLTVRRFIRLSCLGGTPAGYRHPAVPVWDETLFPIHAPLGYRNLEDILPLDSTWHIVCDCGGCGGSGRVNCCSCSGSGQVTDTETRTEYSGGESRTVTRTVYRTCSGCGGSGRQTCGTCQGYGRLVYQQLLVTQWQRLLPALIDPGTHLPDLMEDAEERVYYRLPLVEDRRALQLPTVKARENTLEAKVEESARAVAASLPDAQRMVERLHDGYLYRADFQVAGFWTLGIKYGLLFGRRGWFFGSRPEFHLPCLPLSWGSVGAVLFVLPFCLANIAIGGALLAAWLSDVLPPIPKLD